MTDLTAQQSRVLAFLNAFIEKHGFPPTHAEIAKGLRFRSPNAAAEHLRLMAKKGAVILTPGVSRGVRVEPRKRVAARTPSQAAPSRALPLVGQVAAGQPILAEQNVDREIEVDPEIFRPRADFLLRVRGDSMIEAGILPGDLVAVSKTATIRSGEIAVVRLDEDVTVKRWRIERNRAGTRVVLEPANATYQPMTIDPARTRVAVEGRVVGVLRLGVEG